MTSSGVVLDIWHLECGYNTGTAQIYIDLGDGWKQSFPQNEFSLPMQPIGLIDPFSTLAFTADDLRPSPFQ